MKKKRRKIKKEVYYFLIGFILLIIVIFGGIKYYKHVTSYEYKLEKIGYNESQIEIIIKNEENIIKNVLEKKYDENIPKFIKQKYFMFKNLDRYLNYLKENKNEKLSHIISLVNVGADKGWYDEESVIKTDTSKDILMLVNKLNQLGENYAPDNIKDISNYYSYEGNSIRDDVYTAYKEMWNAAKKEDLTLIVTSSYRDYKTQEKLWDNYADSNGEKWADSVSARAGFSEHQTGLALDIVTYNTVMNDFENTDEFKWLQKNAYKYGFILRYPKGKEDITGYDYESWHYRYVGKDVATAVYKKDITYDEYYAYYIDGEK